MSDVILDITRDPAGTIVSLGGEIDLHETPDFHSALVDLCGEGTPKLILVLSQVQYIDSSGVGTLVEIYRRLKRENRKLILVAPAERVRSVLEITRLDQYFTIVDTPAQAKEI